MTLEYKKYYQMIYSALDEVNPRYWNKIRNKFVIDNNSIVLLPSRKGVILYTEQGESCLFHDVNEIKNFIKEKKQNIYKEQ